MIDAAPFNVMDEWHGAGWDGVSHLPCSPLPPPLTMWRSQTHALCPAKEKQRRSI